MNRILITSGPTREYLDPVRYLTNSSSGLMGLALAEAVLRQGDQPVIVSGPVALTYPKGSEIHLVETTEQMLNKCTALFPECAGVIGAAAPCDFRPAVFSETKITKQPERSEPASGTISFLFSETPDILAALGKIKRTGQWSIAFALETDDTERQGRHRALDKRKRKNSDYIVLNTPVSIGSREASFQVFDSGGELRLTFTGTKRQFAEELLMLVKPAIIHVLPLTGQEIYFL